jgi:tetratricopeptide (TPR) repeat protein
MNGDTPPHEVGPRAREAASQALRWNADLPEAQFAHAYSNWLYDWDWAEAEAAFERTLAIDPGYAWGQLLLGHLFSQSGRHEEADARAARARDLDPLNPMVHALSSQIAFQARQYDRALQHADRAVAIDGEFWIGHMQRAQTLERLGRIEPALDALTSASRYSHVNSKTTSLRGYVLARADRTADARQVRTALEEASQTRYVPPYAMALVSAGLEDWERAFEWLDRAFEARDVHMIFLTADPKWDPVRNDPRFAALLSKCGFLRGSGR